MVKILIIENNIELLQSLKRLLKNEKYEVDTSYDAILGLSYLISNKYDLLLLDLHLERITAKDIITNMMTRGISTRIIGLTSKEIINEKMLDYDYLLNDYLSLPFYCDELIFKIKEVLKTNEDNRFSFFDCNISGYKIEKEKTSRITLMEHLILKGLRDKDVKYNEFSFYEFGNNELWAYIGSINDKLKYIGSCKKIIIENEFYKVVDL